MPKEPERRERGLGKPKYNHHTALPSGGLTESSHFNHVVAVVKVLQRDATGGVGQEGDFLLETSRHERLNYR